ncbi:MULTISPECIES: hypothetical protein [unclassified Enterococcus]|uniref:hypothetical protein n=1 Tax=unclassified Enterococcus TaxID=2608891 RepID=UPI001A9C2376|nr:hypothetical protein [Enterococcus sp. DIV1271a]MBO1300244.1 hypothetical protein [Enterococcus sp. DIV1271a]
MKRQKIAILGTLLFAVVYFESSVYTHAETIIYDPLNPTEHIQIEPFTPELPVTGEEETEVEQTEQSQDIAIINNDKQEVKKQEENELFYPNLSIPKEKKSPRPKLLDNQNNIISQIASTSRKITLDDDFFSDNHPHNQVMLPQSSGAGSANSENGQLAAMSYLFSGTILYGEKPEGRGNQNVQTIFR